MKILPKIMLLPISLLLVGTFTNALAQSDNLDKPNNNAKKSLAMRNFTHSARPSMQKGKKPMKIANRKGLAVITDFADTQLEDWQGLGINNVSELKDQLHKMEQHWAWLSRGQESFKWDVIRVTLPLNLSVNAYPSWWDFRNAVAELIKQQVDVTKYDKNHDGIVDTAWLITANAGQDYTYMMGGASSNNGVNNFVDGQYDLSIISGATGNFNHEVGHTLGLQDTYGPYGTLGYLTLMTDSWPVPPQDFSAYERSVLNWLKPTEIRKSTKKVRLASADKRMQAVRISTLRDNEYFLIEYRHRPDTGFGSVAPAYNGLAVYHILESSSQTHNPPLIKLEAADGYIAPDSNPELADFLYPENTTMQRPFVVHSYYGGAKVFEINNVAWAKDKNSLEFDIALSPLDMAQTNLLSNPSFEQGAGLAPDFWVSDAFEPSSSLVWGGGITKNGLSSVSISSTLPNDARWIQSVSNLVPGKSYEFCGWIRGNNVITTPTAGMGANVSVMGGFVSSASLAGTFDWTKACVTFTADSNSTTLACRLGFYGSTVTGQIWCDDMSLQVMESAF